MLKPESNMNDVLLIQDLLKAVGPAWETLCEGIPNLHTSHGSFWWFRRHGSVKKAHTTVPILWGLLGLSFALS